MTILKVTILPGKLTYWEIRDHQDMLSAWINHRSSCPIYLKQELKLNPTFFIADMSDELMVEFILVFSERYVIERVSTMPGAY